MRWIQFIGRGLPALLLLSWLTTAEAAPPACAPDLVGPWTGKVFNSGVVKELQTNFSTATGELTGTYRVEDEEGGYNGTLTGFTPTGPCAGVFTWRDRHGAGVVHVRFLPNRDRFDGEWGATAPMPGYLFNGRRFRPVPIS